MPAVASLPIFLLAVAEFFVVAAHRRRFGLAAAMLPPLLVLNLTAFLMSRVQFTHYLLPAVPCL